MAGLGDMAAHSLLDALVNNYQETINLVHYKTDVSYDDEKHLVRIGEYLGDPFRRSREWDKEAIKQLDEIVSRYPAAIAFVIRQNAANKIR